VQIILWTAGFKQHSVDGGDLEGQIRLHGQPLCGYYGSVDLNFIGSRTPVRVGDYRVARCTYL
jgi:hypothetical protein